MPCGWTQSSEKWTIIKEQSGDTIIQYNFEKKDLTNLRLYIATLEEYKDLAFINESIVNIQKQQIKLYQSTINNKDSIILLKDKQFMQAMKINKDLDQKVEKYRKKLSQRPYWLITGFVGGIVLCLSLK